MAKTYTNKKNDIQYGAVPEKLVQEQGKVPPNAIDCEEGLLGALMLEEHAYDEICDILTEDSFYEPAHKTIYKAIKELSLKQRRIDILTVSEQLKLMGDLETIGGSARLSELVDRMVSAVNIEEHAGIIQNKFLARDLIRIACEIEKRAFSEQTEVKELLEFAEGQIFEISQRSVKKDVSSIGEIMNSAIDRIKSASEQADGYTGLPSGFHDLDQMTNGWQPATLNIIAARPAMGKTAFVLSMAKNMAVDYKRPVAVFSLEMSNLELVNRLIINVSEIPGENIKKGNLTDEQWQQLYTNTQCLNDAPIYVDDTANMSVSELNSKARRLKTEKNIGCIIIDYLQLMNASGMSYGSREQEVSIISRSLKGLAKELDIPVIALSQLNRGVENRKLEEKRPQLADLRESGAIEQDADMVLFIHRPEYYNIMEDPATGQSNKGVAEIIIAKHRSGSVGDIRLRFTSHLIRFSNIDPNEVIIDDGHYTSNQDFEGKDVDISDFKFKDDNDNINNDPFL